MGSRDAFAHPGAVRFDAGIPTRWIHHLRRHLVGILPGRRLDVISGGWVCVGHARRRHHGYLLLLTVCARGGHREHVRNRGTRICLLCIRVDEGGGNKTRRAIGRGLTILTCGLVRGHGERNVILGVRVRGGFARLARRHCWVLTEEAWVADGGHEGHGRGCAAGGNGSWH